MFGTHLFGKKPDTVRDNPGTVFDTSEGRIVHTWEWTKTLLKDSRTVAVFVTTITIVALLSVGITSLLVGRSQAALAATNNNPVAALVYHNSGHHVTITVQQFNPGDKAYYFRVSITTENAHRVTETTIVEMRASPPRGGGSTYMLTCTLDAKHKNAWCGVLELDHPPVDGSFNGTGDLRLLIFPAGYYPLTPAV